MTEALRKVDSLPIARVAIHGGSMDALRGAQHVVLTKCGKDPPLRCRWFPRAAGKLLEGHCRCLGARRNAQREDSLAELGGKLCASCIDCGTEALHRDLFRFELILTIDWAVSGRRPKDCLAAQRRHYAEVALELRGPDSGVLHRLLWLLTAPVSGNASATQGE